jgi:hypothetical protein
MIGRRDQHGSDQHGSYQHSSYQHAAIGAQLPAHSCQHAAANCHQSMPRHIGRVLVATHARTAIKTCCAKKTALTASAHCAIGSPWCTRCNDQDGRLERQGKGGYRMGTLSGGWDKRAWLVR